MSVTDPIADLLVQMKNAAQRGKASVTLQASKMKLAILQVLKHYRFIRNYEVLSDSGKNMVTIELAYYDGMPAIVETKRLSKPSQRHYVSADNLKKHKAKNEVTILSTNQGVVSLGDAMRRGIGGELLCRVS